MKTIIYIATILLLCIHCATPKVTYDYDRKVNFNVFKTYNFHPNINLSSLDQFEGKRVLAAIDKEMQNRGYNKSENPELYINVVPDIKEEKQQNSAIGFGIGGYNNGLGMDVGVQLPIYSTVVNTRFILEINETQNMHLIWQGFFANSQKPLVDPVQKDIYISQSINKLLINFPPNN